MNRFLLSSLLAFVGGHMLNYTVILYLQERIGSDALAGVGFGLAFGSSLVFGWFGGVLADRLAPGRLIHAAHGLFLLALCGLLWAELGVGDDGARVPMVLLSAFSGGLGWSLFGPARLATLGQIVPATELARASMLFNLQVLLGFGLAPLAIGLARTQAGWPAVMATAMFCYGLSSLLLLGTRTQARAADGATGSMRAEIGAGFAAVRRDPLLAQLLGAAMIGFAMTGPLQILLPRFAQAVLRLSETERGAFLGMMALALIAGGALALPLARHVHQGRAIFSGLIGGGLLFASLHEVTSTPLACAVLFGVGLCGGFVIALVIAAVQLRAPAPLRGRIMSMYSIISQVLPAASGMLAGSVLGVAGIAEAIRIEGGALAALALLALLGMPALRNMAR